MDFVRKQWRPNGAACSQPRATPWVFNSQHINPPRRGKSLIINYLFPSSILLSSPRCGDKLTEKGYIHSFVNHSQIIILDSFDSLNTLLTDLAIILFNSDSPSLIVRFIFLYVSIIHIYKYHALPGKSFDNRLEVWIRGLIFAKSFI